MKNYNFTFILLMLTFISTKLFSQLDSVYYQGPSQGTVSGGAIQTTDNFTDEPFSPTGELKTVPLVKSNVTDQRDLIFGWNDSRLPEYKYVEDSQVNDENHGNSGQPVLLNSFLGIPMTNFIPPDPTIAVGPNHIIVCANSNFRILDKQGNILKIISAGPWWNPAWPDENGDPQVIYDHYAGRWVLVWLQVNDAALTAGNLIAYSDDDNPLGTWYMYRLDTKMHGSVPSNTWGDYPKVGYDEEAIYIMTRCISFGGGLLYNKIRIINKSEFYSSNGGPFNYTDLWDIRTPGQGIGGAVLDCINPGISYTLGNGGWFFWARGVYGGNPVSADFYALYKIVNPLTAPTLRGKVLPVQLYTSPPLANQLGGGLGIETIGWITKGPVIRDGYLYAAHDIQNSTNSNYSSVKYLKVDLSSLSIVDNIEFGNEGYFYLFPAISVDQDHNAALTYSRTADTEYIGSYFSTKYANDPVLGPSQPIAEGQGNYVLTYGGGINRWGDYFGICLDPANNYEFWTISEYAANTNIWSTYVAHIRMTPFSGAHAYLKPESLDFGDVEIGTTSTSLSTILANYGDEDLVITDIPSSFNEFNLETSITFPDTLQSYDSLLIVFNYSPSVLGEATVAYPISTNDPEFTGITLSGNSYSIIPATEKMFYASSGMQNNGEILTIDETTGTGMIIGSSLFDEIKGIAIQPVSGVIYGLVSGSGSADIVRVNAETGNSFTLFSLSIPQMADVAFDTLGNFYGINRNGELYSIDLTNGTYALIVDALGSYSGITFHPFTNELWATSRALTAPNKDAIVKINLATGDTLIVGHTGLGKNTNDIVFDENLNLFGVIGSDTELNDFISINVSTGEGAIIGSVGYKHILGLGYTETVVTDVEEGNDEALPFDFALKQNYPNPFNPTTKIEFSLPVNSKVKLTVFNILGQQVATLFDEEMSAGNHTVQWNADDVSGSKLSSGVYLYKLNASGVNSKEFQQTKKMVLLK